jgi:hypothetical protein
MLESLRAPSAVAPYNVTPVSVNCARAVIGRSEAATKMVDILPIFMVLSLS